MNNKKADFDITNMPHNRKEVFFDVLKNRFGTLLLIGFILFLSIIPFILVYLYSSIEGTKLYTSGLTDDEIYQGILSITMLKYLLYIPCFGLLGFILTGLNPVIQKIVWQEGFIFKNTFFKGIKDGKALLVNILSYLLLGILLFLLMFVNVFKPESNVFVKAVTIAAFVLFIPNILFLETSTAIYKLPVSGYFKNSMLFSMRNFFITILVVLLNVSFCFLFLINNMIFQLILLFVLPLLIAPLLLLFDTLYTNSIYDKFINKDSYPEIYDKGVFRNAKD